MNFAVFDENYYLENNPDVKAAVQAGTLESGLTHFQKFGLREGRVVVSPYYGEAGYLQKYPDVASAVQSGAFKSGLEHFINFGFDEGRTPFRQVDDAVYLQKYPDVAQGVQAGSFKSGYAHFIQFGLAEGRSPTFFNEAFYLANNPDVAGGVQAEAIESGFDHYVRLGINEQGRSVLFSGTSGNDRIRSFGGVAAVSGVSFDPITGGRANVTPTSFGVGEVDTLIGGASRNNFVLGLRISPGSPNPQAFYIGRGDADYAVIQNFNPASDTIQIAGAERDYIRQPDNGNLRILTATGDLVAIVERVSSLNQVDANPNDGDFLLGGG